MNYIDLLLYLKQIQQNQQLIHHYKYHYNNDKEWKFLYGGTDVQTIPSNAAEVWASIRVYYSPNGYMTKDFTFGVGLSSESVRRYIGGYFYDINNYMNFAINYDPASRKVNFDTSSSWFICKYSGSDYALSYNMSIWYR